MPTADEEPFLAVCLTDVFCEILETVLFAASAVRAEGDYYFTVKVMAFQESQNGHWRCSPPVGITHEDDVIGENIIPCGLYDGLGFYEDFPSDRSCFADAVL